MIGEMIEMAKKKIAIVFLIIVKTGSPIAKKYRDRDHDTNALILYDRINIAMTIRINRIRHSNGDIADGSQPFSMEEAI